MSDRLVLKTALGKYEHVKPLKDGRVTSDRVELQFLDFDPIPKAFRLMLRGGELDLSEMAICTHVVAHHFGKPITGLAIPLWGRLPHANLVCATGSDIGGPADLNGRKVGVRAYAQTSGVWVRGILKDDYGVDLDGITWVTMEDSHVAEATDPPNCVRNQTSKGLRQLLLDGELAAIMGEREVDPANVRPVIENPEQVASAWIERIGIAPINHAVAVNAALVSAHPWLAGELMRMFEDAMQLAVAGGAEPPPPYGLEASRASLQLAFDYCADQKLTPRVYRADECYHPL